MRFQFLLISPAMLFIFVAGNQVGERDESGCQPYGLPNNSRWLDADCDNKAVSRFQCNSGYPMVIKISCIDDKWRSEAICKDIDDCRGNPCQNNGTCVDGIESFSCNCAEGFTGDTCGEKIDPCLPDPCQNGGSCTETGDGFNCACPPGAKGTLCEDCGMLEDKFLDLLSKSEISDLASSSLDDCKQKCSKQSGCNGAQHIGLTCYLYGLPLVETRIDVSSAEDCLKVCSANKDCTAFTYYNECYAYNTTTVMESPMQDESFAVTGFKSCEKLFPPQSG